MWLGNRPEMTIAIDWDVKHQIKQTNQCLSWKKVLLHMYLELNGIKLKINFSFFWCMNSAMLAFIIYLDYSVKVY